MLHSLRGKMHKVKTPVFVGGDWSEYEQNMPTADTNIKILGGKNNGHSNPRRGKSHGLITGSVAYPQEAKGKRHKVERSVTCIN